MTAQPYDRNAVASERQQLVEVAGFSGYFATKTGGETSADTSKVWDGGRLKPSTLSAPAATSNLVVTRPYRPGQHKVTLDKLEKLVGRWRTTVSVWDTDPDLGPVGSPTVYANSLLARVKRPDHDAGSSDAGVFELEFGTDGPA